MWRWSSRQEYGRFPALPGVTQPGRSATEIIRAVLTFRAVLALLVHLGECRDWRHYSEEQKD
jgi:hypothetical protein